ARFKRAHPDATPSEAANDPQIKECGSFAGQNLNKLSLTTSSKALILGIILLVIRIDLLQLCIIPPYS
ncbi:hypothetical protein, partial [Collinsella tanakaei]|uniref:hypothetical protein n=1 Tax=Collinsella tanakaei TaxID=626935 RepID=UPI001C705EC2